MAIQGLRSSHNRCDAVSPAMSWEILPTTPSKNILTHVINTQQNNYRSVCMRLHEFKCIQISLYVNQFVYVNIHACIAKL